jgi:hypothetical protein
LNAGTLVINKTTVSGNSASARFDLHHPSFALGGGIYNVGTMFISNATVAGNSAVVFFGNTRISGSGGGIYNIKTVDISNSTVSSNNAVKLGSGGIANDSGTATFQNTIIANNSRGNCDGTMISNGYNLSSDGSCNLSGPGDLNNTDPMIGPLQNNGGPTQTMALPSGSPAIDAGNPSGCTDGHGHLLRTDQRGQPRPDKEDSGGCDMGAYELQTD